MATSTQQAYAEALLFDTATGKIQVYHPLVITAGKTPAIPVAKPTLTATTIVGLWFGFNGDKLHLTGTGLTLGNCVNGLPNGDVFGQVAGCNAKQFFAAVNAATAKGVKLNPPPPPLGTATDGGPCLTTRDFALIDQDQSDNVVTTYLLTGTGQTAVNTATNKANLAAATEITNGSDNALLEGLNGLMQCKSYKAPSVQNNGLLIGAQGLKCLSAALHQQKPIALVPKGDPMVRVTVPTTATTTTTFANLGKLNLYRELVNQPPAANLGEASTLFYCYYMSIIQPARLMRNKALFLSGKINSVNCFYHFFRNAFKTCNTLSFTHRHAHTHPAGPTVDAAVGNNMFTFLSARFVGSYGNMNCGVLLGAPAPMKVPIQSVLCGPHRTAERAKHCPEQVSSSPIVCISSSRRMSMG
jgi:hypothetical protein